RCPNIVWYCGWQRADDDEDEDEATEEDARSQLLFVDPFTAAALAALSSERRTLPGI
ncbi:GH11861, partial [Drosophila grimshawi]